MKNCKVVKKSTTTNGNFLRVQFDEGDFAVTKHVKVINNFDKYELDAEYDIPEAAMF